MEQKQVLSNAKWIIACKIIQSLLQLVIGMLSARYLGPSNYGLISYASSVVAFALPIMRLGLNSTLVHELVNAPEKEGEIMGTSLLMNLISGVLCIFGVTGFAAVANAGDTTTIIVCILYSLSLVFAALEMIQYWFQYKLQSKYTSLVMLGSYLVVSAYKIFLLVTGKSVFWFALTNSLDYGIIAVALIGIYFKLGAKKFRFSISMAKQMLKSSKHYILAALMVVVFQSTDHIMLTTIDGKMQNGYYAAAVTCAGVVQFVYSAIIDSYCPLILSNKKENSPEYGENISRLYCIIIYMSIAQSIVFTLLAKPIISILYGSDYAPAISVLRILVWFLAFSYIGTVRNVWILAEQKQKYLWIINLTGAFFNIVLNAFMIPVWGANGAALASLLTQFFTNFILGFIFKPIRENNRLLLKGLNPVFLKNQGKYFLNVIKSKK